MRCTRYRKGARSFVGINERNKEIDVSVAAK